MTIKTKKLTTVQVENVNTETYLDSYETTLDIEITDNCLILQDVDDIIQIFPLANVINFRIFENDEDE